MPASAEPIDARNSEKRLRGEAIWPPRTRKYQTEPLGATHSKSLHRYPLFSGSPSAEGRGAEKYETNRFQLQLKETKPVRSPHPAPDGHQRARTSYPRAGQVSDLPCFRPYPTTRTC
jgi:hypothetical protein